MSIRKPAVAGYFYPAGKQELEKTIVSLMGKDLSVHKKNRIKGIILPHAGYQYSGAVAAETIVSSDLKNTLIMLGPNHTGLGESFSVMVAGSWQMPFGNVEIDSPLAKKIVEGSRYLRDDVLAHRSEHSIEVLIPFLQFIKKEIKIVPIIVARADMKTYQAIAEDIVRAISDLKIKEEISIIASSDMTHYESQESAKKKDNVAIEAILNLHTDELIRNVDDLNITMCGIAPVAIMMEIVKALGAKQGYLVKYQTSGDVTGDYSSVVGYAGVRIN